MLQIRAPIAVFKLRLFAPTLIALGCGRNFGLLTLILSQHRLQSQLLGSTISVPFWDVNRVLCTAEGHKKFYTCNEFLMKTYQHYCDPGVKRDGVMLIRRNK